jgi:hypothetical protein
MGEGRRLQLTRGLAGGSPASCECGFFSALQLHRWLVRQAEERVGGDSTRDGRALLTGDTAPGHGPGTEAQAEATGRVTWATAG